VRTRIKICGITRAEDAVLALGAGADYIGLVLTESPRRLDRERALAIRAAVGPEAALVGVFDRESPDVVAPFVEMLGLRAVQVGGWIESGDAVPAEVWHTLRLESLPEPDTLPMVPLRTYLLDAHDARLPGGTGKRADWTWAKRCVTHGRRLIVAGGLDPENVVELVREVRPFGVDASSGLEREVGRKDADKVRRFIDRIRKADADRPKRS